MFWKIFFSVLVATATEAKLVTFVNIGSVPLVVSFTGLDDVTVVPGEVNITVSDTFDGTITAVPENSEPLSVRTKVELTLGTTTDTYSVNLEDGFNLKAKVVPENSGTCTASLCMADLLKLCPVQNQVTNSVGTVVACKNSELIFTAVCPTAVSGSAGLSATCLSSDTYLVLLDPTPRWSILRSGPEFRPYSSLPRASQDASLYSNLVGNRDRAQVPSPLLRRRRSPTRRTRSEDIYEERTPLNNNVEGKSESNTERPSARINPLVRVAEERKERKSPKRQSRDGSSDSRDGSNKEYEEEVKKDLLTPEATRKMEKNPVEKRVSFDNNIGDKMDKNVLRTHSFSEYKKNDSRPLRVGRSLQDDHSDNSDIGVTASELRYAREESAPIELCDIEPLSGTVFRKVTVRRRRQDNMRKLPAVDSGWRRTSQTETDLAAVPGGSSADILLPSGDDYRLVFVGSSDGSSKEDEADDSSSTASSFPPLTDECDWDYFEPGAGAVRVVAWGAGSPSPFGSPATVRRGAATTALVVDSPLGSPLVCRRRLRESDTGTDEDTTRLDSGSPASSDGLFRSPEESSVSATLRCFHLDESPHHHHQKTPCHACGAPTQYIPIPVPVPIPFPVPAWSPARLKSLSRNLWPYSLVWPTLYPQANLTVMPKRDEHEETASASASSPTAGNQQEEELSGYLECENRYVTSSDSSQDSSDSSDASREGKPHVRRVYNVSGVDGRQSDDALPSSDITSDCDGLSQSSVREDDMSSSGSADTDSDDTGTVADQKPKRFSRIFVVNKNMSSSSNECSSSSDSDTSDNDTDTERDCTVILTNVKQLDCEDCVGKISDDCDNDGGDINLRESEDVVKDISKQNNVVTGNNSNSNDVIMVTPKPDEKCDLKESSNEIELFPLDRTKNDNRELFVDISRILTKETDNDNKELPNVDDQKSTEVIDSITNRVENPSIHHSSYEDTQEIGNIDQTNSGISIKTLLEIRMPNENADEDDHVAEDQLVRATVMESNSSNEKIERPDSKTDQSCSINDIMETAIDVVNIKDTDRKSCELFETPSRENNEAEEHITETENSNQGVIEDNLIQVESQLEQPREYSSSTSTIEIPDTKTVFEDINKSEGNIGHPSREKYVTNCTSTSGDSVAASSQDKCKLPDRILVETNVEKCPTSVTTDSTLIANDPSLFQQNQNMSPDAVIVSTTDKSNISTDLELVKFHAERKIELITKDLEYISSSPGLSDVSAESLNSSDVEGNKAEEPNGDDRGTEWNDIVATEEVGADTLAKHEVRTGATQSIDDECSGRGNGAAAAAASARYTSLVMITQESPACYQQVSVVTTDTTTLVEDNDVVVRHTNWQEEAAKRTAEGKSSGDNQIRQGESVTVITGGETLSAFEEGLADDDSWVENLSHDGEDDDDEDDFATNSPTDDSSSGEEVTLTCSAAIDQEDELRGYHRTAIDFTLHTIVEESCEESEVEQNAPKFKERPASATDLEKYFFFGLGDGNAPSLTKEDAFSETSSIYSEGMESLGGPEENQQQNDNSDPAELASSRLEKYFLSGFMGFTAERRDSDGSVGSDSEGKPSPEQRRKRLVRARGTGRSHSSSLDNLDNAVNDTATDTQINSENSSSSDSDTYDEVNNFEKSDGQFDTVKRKKGKKHKNPSSPADDSKNLETTQEVDERENESDEDEDGHKTPQPENIASPSNLTTNNNQQSRDSGFVGSCDDLLKDQRDNHTPDLPSNKSDLKVELENITEETKIDEKVSCLSTPPTTSLTRKDSFNNWSSDEETNLMMSKMRQFFKTMVANSQCNSSSKPTTPNLDVRLSPKPRTKSRCKPPQLVYFENELTRLMKTVPGLRDDQVREIVEYLSSEDTWSDSYDSSDYTSSDLEGASTKSALQQQISDSCKQIINKFDTSVDDEGDEGDGGIIDKSHGLNKETAFVYQKLVASFEKMATGDSDGGNIPKLNTHSSPPLIAKVMHHIGSRLVALMHEVSSGESHTSNSPKTKHYHRRLQHKISSASSTTTEDDCPETNFRGFEDPVTPYNLLLRSRSHDLLVAETRTSNQSGVSDPIEEREASDCERFSWRGSFESALLATDSRNKLSLLGGEGSASASALAIAAKRRSAGDLLFSHKSLSREQLDRVRSCGSIGGANSEDKLWVATTTARPNRRRSSVPDATSCGSGGSADGEDEDEDMESVSGSRSTLPRSLQGGAQTTNSLPRLPTNAVGNVMQKSQSMYHFLPQNVKSARYRPPGFSRLLTTVPKRAVSAPGLQPSHQRRGRRSQQQNVPIGHATIFLHLIIHQETRSTPEGANIKKIIVPTKELLEHKVLRLRCSNKSGTASATNHDVAEGEEDEEKQEEPIKILCSVEEDDNGVSTEPQDDVSITEAHSSPILSSRNGKSATPSPVAPGSRRTTGTSSTGSSQEWHCNDDDIDRLVGLHGRSSLSSLGLRSDSMASVYSGAGGEGRYGAVTVRGQVEFGLQYNYKAGTLEVQVGRCRDLAAVDAKRGRSDPYVKAYLLPDRSKGGKRKTKVKKHTLNPVFDECLKFHISLNGLETRTLWLTVWHSDMFGRNDFLGEVLMTLENKVFDDPTPKWYNLQERTEPFEDVQAYKGDIIVCLKFVPPDMTIHKKGKRSRGALHVLVKEAKSLTAVKANGTSDPFCKSYLLPDKGRSSKQKTPVTRRSVNPVWNYTFVYDDVTLQELAERCLELTVWDHDRLASNEFLGGVRFSLGTGKHYGKSVEWMDASGKELSLWKSMLEKPNFWVEGCLSLRPTLDTRPT